ncbi:MAG: 50S ribosomal protein L35, partial [Cyanobacteria bacterium]|nr:50S ribosomal protein L35 [Cyanobacteriota bacterium]
MPKMKTNKAARRRFKITGTGKILRRQSGTRHINEWMS